MNATMRFGSISMFVVAIALAAPSASADDKCAEAYAVGKDIARLDAEVNAMKKLLAELLELDRRRTALLSRALADGGSVDITALSPSSPPPRASDSGTEGKSRRPKKKPGSVSGRVRGAGAVAFVYVGDIRGRLVRGKTAKVAQKNRKFSPEWLVVQRGTSVRFPNEDGIYHNVFSKSASANFDLGIYRRGDKAQSYTFTKPGLVDIHCNMHAKMNSEILVVPNHMYTRAKRDGSFSLSRIPAGRRKIVAWAPGMRPTEKWVNVPANGNAKIELVVKPRRKGHHLNKDGQPYGSYE